MQYSLPTAVLFALTLGTNIARNQVDEITTDAQDWANDIVSVSTFIETVTTLSPSDLASQGAAIVQTFANEHTQEAQLNSDLPGNDGANDEFNDVFKSVVTALQNIRNSGQKFQPAQQPDIDTALGGLCGGVNDAANTFFLAAEQVTDVSLTAHPPSNCP